MNISGKRKKALLALGFVAFILVAFGGLSWIPLGFDEMRLRASSLTVAGVVETGVQRVIEFDADKPLTYYSDPWPHGRYEGFEFPTVRYTVEYSGEPVRLYDNVTVTKHINETHTEYTEIYIWEYIFRARIKLVPKNDVVIGVRSAFEGNGPGQWHGTIFNFKAIMEIELVPFEWREEGEVLGITWMQFENLTVDWGRWKTIEENSACIGYEPTMDVSNVGEVWGSVIDAKEAYGRIFPNLATISIQGQARSGCYAYYETGLFTLPGRLYQYVECSPTLTAEIKLHVAGTQLWIEGEEDVIPPPPPPPPDPPEPIPWILIIVVGVLIIAFMALAAPRLIRAWRGK